MIQCHTRVPAFFVQLLTSVGRIIGYAASASVPQARLLSAKLILVGILALGCGSCGTCAFGAEFCEEGQIRLVALAEPVVEEFGSFVCNGRRPASDTLCREIRRLLLLPQELQEFVPLLLGFGGLVALVLVSASPPRGRGGLLFSCSMAS